MVTEPGPDNRRYDYTSSPVSERAEYPVIVDLIAAGSKVIDYGCGNGSLLKLLRDRKGCEGLGLELSPSGVEATRAKGLDARVAEIDKPHAELGDGSYDYAVCNVTMQMVMYPEVLLTEMLRVARYQIVSFPNLGLYRNRIDLLLHGRMPRPSLYGYEWYSTGHIHPFSVQDFVGLCEKSGAKILKFESLNALKPGLKRQIAHWFPNLFVNIGVFLLEKESPRR